MEVTLPGHALRSHEHTAGAGAGWGAIEGGSVERDKPGCYCMFCLVSHPCATEPACRAARGSCIFLLHFRGSHWTIARKSSELPFVLAAELNGKVVVICFSEQSCWSCFDHCPPADEM